MDVDVQTTLTENSASATAVVPAAASEVFEFVRRPANHPVISGDHSVKGAIKGPDALRDGDRFGMSMKLGVPYRISSKVVEFEEGRRIAWCHLGGHRWRWQFEDLGDGTCRVTETFDASTSKAPWALKIAGYPKRHLPNVEGSVRNVAEHFATAAT